MGEGTKGGRKIKTANSVIYPIVSDDAEVQAFYEECRRNGTSHNMAEILSFRKPPRVRNTYSPMHPRRNRGRGY